MRTDIALFLTVLAAIAITGQLVRNYTGSSQIIKTTFTGLSGLMGATITGDPRFYSPDAQSHQ